MTDDLHKRLEQRLDAMLADIEQRGDQPPTAPTMEDIVSLAELVDILEGIHYEQLAGGQSVMPAAPSPDQLLH